MNNICSFCRTPIAIMPVQVSNTRIAGAVCEACEMKFRTTTNPSMLKRLVDAIDAPLLVMQKEPRQVYTANQKALKLFAKEIGQVEARRGGRVFDCAYAFTKAGCGKDEHCKPCRIKNAIVETLITGNSASGVAVLTIKKDDGLTPATLQVTSEKIGDMALVRIDRYVKIREEAPGPDDDGRRQGGGEYERGT